MSFIVVCDIRERELYAELSKQYGNDDIMLLKKEQLPLGDITISYGSSYHMLLERKTKADMISSVKDGRYKCQGARMAEALAAGDISDYGYILETSSGPSYFANRIKKKDERILRGCLMSVLLRDRRPIWFSNDVADTAKWIYDIGKRLCNDDGRCDIFKSQQPMSSSDHMKKYTKSAGMTPVVCFHAQLCQIPKISVAKANTIMTKYNSMRDICVCGYDVLMKELVELPGIGNKLAHTICEYIGVYKPCATCTDPNFTYSLKSPSPPPPPSQDILDLEDFENDNSES